jgi:uncharacterized circularly permuted ATP-grasp superfamily protein
MARLTPKQHTENRAQHFRFVSQRRLVNQWQTRIGITDISQLGPKQLRKKQKQLQRQIRNKAITFRQAIKRQHQVSNSG